MAARPTTRVLYLLADYPQLSETYVKSEIEAARAVGSVEVFVIALEPVYAPYRNHAPFIREKDEAKMLEIASSFEPDLVHTHYFTYAEKAHRLARGLDVPFTVRAHSYDVLGTPLGRDPSPKAKACRDAVNDQDCLGMLTFPFTRSMLEEAGVKAEKLRDCHPVVNVPLFLDESPNGEGVMNVGATMPKKGLQEFIRLASLTDEAMPFSLYGIGRTDHLEEQNQAVGGRVIFRDPVMPEKMLLEYKKHSWLVYTASREMGTVGWPIAVAEAQAAGVGVCMPSLRPDIADFLGGAGIIFDDVEELRDVVSKPVPEEMRQCGFEVAKRSDVWEHIHILLDLWA